MTSLYGLQVICSVDAIRKERTFPESKNRSKRIHKKLLKRFGSEFFHAPACYRMGDTLVIHPELLEGLRSFEKTFNRFVHFSEPRRAGKSFTMQRLRDALKPLVPASQGITSIWIDETYPKMIDMSGT